MAKKGPRWMGIGVAVGVAIGAGMSSIQNKKNMET